MTEHLNATAKSSGAELFLAKGPGDRNLGVVIKAAREAKGYTQHTLAYQLGVQKSAVSQWEKGKNHIKDENRRALALALDIPLEVMFRVDAADNAQLSEQERMLLDRFRRLPPDTRKAFLLILSSYDPPGSTS